MQPLHPIANSNGGATAPSIPLSAAASSDVHKADLSGRTPMLAATTQGQIHAIIVLVRAKVDVDQADAFGSTPTLTASEAGAAMRLRCGWAPRPP